MAEERKTALIVAFDQAVRSRVGAWLEEAGFEVLLCAGPGRPDYRCIASTGHDCPLGTSADVVVLDAWLESDADDAGTTAPDLVRYYRSRGRPLVILDHGRDTPTVIATAGTVLVGWPPMRRQVEGFALALASRRNGDQDG